MQYKVLVFLFSMKIKKWGMNVVAGMGFGCVCSRHKKGCHFPTGNENKRRFILKCGLEMNVRS
jgi:hypothetical protein